jgi:hypothetical protein
MATVYQLMSGDEQIGDIYYDVHDAIDNARQIARETNIYVELWEAEEIEDIPVDCLEWTLRTIRF